MNGIQVEVSVKTKLTAKFIRVDAEVRYWEDAAVNGVEDTEGSLIPLRSGDCWAPIIDLMTGQIQNWPQGTTADIHYKVCDAGLYWLLDENLKKIAKWSGHYVPDAILCVGDNGYGDYIIMTVGQSGIIEGWQVPNIDGDEWEVEA